MVEIEDLAREHTQAWSLCWKRWINFIVHPVRTIWEPTQEIEFLGMRICSSPRTPAPRRKNEEAQARKSGKELWMWCLKRWIYLSTQHLPRVENTTADSESRDERSLLLDAERENFKQDYSEVLQLKVDLFASSLTFRLERFFNWRPDPLAEATDAFQQNWTMILSNTNPPWNLVGRVLNLVEQQGAEIVLIAQYGIVSQTAHPLVATPLSIQPATDLMWKFGRGACQRWPCGISQAKLLKQKPFWRGYRPLPSLLEK